MSAAMKFGLLALVSSAAAVSHVGSHNKFHERRAAANYGGGYEVEYPASSSEKVPSHATDKPYPVGGWGNYNGTHPSPSPSTPSVPEGSGVYPTGDVPEGTGHPPKPSGTGYPPKPSGGNGYPVGGDKSTKVPSGNGKTSKPAEGGPKTLTKTIYEAGEPKPTGGSGDYEEEEEDHEESTTTSTITSYTTVTVWPTTAASVGVNEVPTGKYCGVETVYVTAHEKVTITVKPSEGKPEVPAPTKPAAEYPVEQPKPSAPAEAPKPSAPAEAPKPSSAPVEYSVVKPEPSKQAEPSKEAVYTSAAVEKPTPVSSAAPAPSTPAGDAPGYKGGKRGLAYQDASLCSAFEGAGFAYNWEAIPKGDLGSTPFIPMLRRFSVEGFYQTPQQWLDVIEDSFKAGSKAVMAFNEPDIPSQDNYSPEQVCDLMEKYTNPIASSHPEVTIIGPSVSNSNIDGQGLTWLSKFHSSCTKATWHANNIHFYDDYNEGVFERFQSHVEQAVKDGGKPVWVTEIGLNPGTASDDQAAEFMKKCMSYLEGNDQVQGYAWFMVGTGAQQLTANSVLGKAYASA